MSEFRIELNCRKCGFGIKGPFTEDFPNFYKTFVEHFVTIGHKEYDIKVTPGCSREIQEIHYGPPIG